MCTQLGNEWPSQVSEAHKHSPRSTGEASDSCKFLGQRCCYRPVVHAWTYSASLATITTTSDSVNIGGWDNGSVHV